MIDPVKGGAGVVVRSWRAVRKGQLRGFLSVDLPCGLQISDIALLDGADGPWVRLPQMPRVRNGVQLKSETGTPLWNSPIVWQSRQLQNEFSAAVIAIIRNNYPGALDPPASAAADAPG